jgi:hypothetical protein
MIASIFTLSSRDGAPIVEVPRLDDRTRLDFVLRADGSLVDARDLKPRYTDRRPWLVARVAAFLTLRRAAPSAWATHGPRPL